MTEYTSDEICEKCLKNKALCVCTEAEPFDNKHFVLIMQHPQEEDKELGTAGILKSMLKNAKLEVALSRPSLRGIFKCDDESKINPIKYQYILDKLNNYRFVDEEHGILTIEQIKKSSAEVFADYTVEYCYLFGSYAKGKAKETSDVDLLVATAASGMEFFGFVESLRETLKKKVDVLDVAQLNNNPTLVQEILKDGIKIYG